MSNIPLDVSRAVTNVSAKASVNAPIATVWGVLLDFPSYHLWNSFVRSQAIVDTSFKPLLAHPEPTQGANLLIHVRVPPRGLDDDDKNLRAVKLIITMVDNENHRIAWKEVGSPNWLLRTERWQELTEEQVDGRTTTTYRTVEVFNGPVAWLVRWFLHRKLKISFETMAEGLKRRSEDLAEEARSRPWIEAAIRETGTSHSQVSREGSDTTKLTKK